VWVGGRRGRVGFGHREEQLLHAHGHREIEKGRSGPSVAHQRGEQCCRRHPSQRRQGVQVIVDSRISSGGWQHHHNVRGGQHHHQEDNKT
jgi:hypothetical protein